ncbi:MAG: vitamin K epoxide reductase family protein [Armatimonadetes bacterium]|nr:vitamin K epoxide reductase family protein [Armatimonadota bacterium]
MVITILVLFMALIGFADSFYYTLLHYGYLGFQSPVVPMICELKQSVCRTLATSAWASTFGIPNSIFGMGYYALVGIAAVSRFKLKYWPFGAALTAISIFAALFSIYLAWAMVFMVHEICPLCVAAQVINIILAIIFTTTR